MTTLTLSVENDSNALLYVMDETALRTESDIRRSWSPVGESPILESNNSHEGVNIVGATEITKKFETVCDVYPAEQPITGLEIEEFIKYLLNHNPDKKIYLVLDNARPHNNHKIQEKIPFLCKLLMSSVCCPCKNSEKGIFCFLIRLQRN